MTDVDTNEVEITLHIKARPETVYRFWTDPKRICDWWGESADLDPRPGGTYRVEMANGGVMLGEFVELVPHERIVFSFGWEPTEGWPDVPPGSSRVEITFADDDGDTILTLRHTGLPESEAAKHNDGWNNVLPGMVEAVEAVAQDPDSD